MYGTAFGVTFDALQLLLCRLPLYHDVCFRRLRVQSAEKLLMHVLLCFLSIYFFKVYCNYRFVLLLLYASINSVGFLDQKSVNFTFVFLFAKLYAIRFDCYFQSTIKTYLLVNLVHCVIY